MRFRKQTGGAGPSIAVQDGDRWVPLREACEHVGADPVDRLGAAPDDLVGILAGGEPVRERIEALCSAVSGVPFTSGTVVLPFEPRSLRCFSGWQAHWEQAARVLAGRYHPLGGAARGFIRAYETVTRSTFPLLRPGKEYFSHPVYYTGNHLNTLGDGATVPWPAYCHDLDYELEVAALVVRPLLDASERVATEAIGGFVVFNDFSSRDTQWVEHRDGLFGPVVKTKSFANTMSCEVASADEVLPHLHDLAASVSVNGELWSSTSTAGMRYSIGEMAAHASLGERVHPGELLATGTLPRGCGMELDRRLAEGDAVTLEVERIGSLTNRVGRRGEPVDGRSGGR